jgi:nitrate/nitrite transporter NarK
MDVRVLWPLVGLAFGVVLGFAGAFGGVGPFFLVLFLGALGFVVGRVIEGDLDLREIFSTGGARRRPR